MTESDVLRVHAKSPWDGTYADDRGQEDGITPLGDGTKAYAKDLFRRETGPA
jgi:hypothetical protein